MLCCGRTFRCPIVQRAVLASTTRGCRWAIVTLSSSWKRNYHELSFRAAPPPAAAEAASSSSGRSAAAVDARIDPLLQVLEYHSDPTMKTPRPPTLTQPYVRVEMLCASLNPADWNMITGTYPSPYRRNSAQEKFAKSKRAAALGGRSGTTTTTADQWQIGGSEGWGRVVEVVGDTGELTVGDLVTPSFSGFGTWRSSLWLPADHLIRVPHGAELLAQHGPANIAPLFQTAGTALRLLSDFVELRLGDVVVQNAGNSAVGLLASQMAAAVSGAITVSLVRRKNRSTVQYDEMVQYLMETGKNAAVFAEEDLLQDADALQQCRETIRRLGAAPQLALNAVGGESASLLLKLLGDGGTMVTYGAMAQQPLQVKPTHFIFRDLRMLGYWHSRWMAQGSKGDDRSAMVGQLVSLVLQNQVQCPPVECFALSDFSSALKFHAQQSHAAIRKKVVFDCGQSQKKED